MVYGVKALCGCLEKNGRSGRWYGYCSLAYIGEINLTAHRKK